MGRTMVPKIIKHKTTTKQWPLNVKIKKPNATSIKRLINTRLANRDSKIITPAKLCSSPAINNNSKLSNSSQRISSLYNALSSNLIIVLLKDPIYLRGTVKLQLVAGSIQVYGYKPDINEELDIFSPRGSSLVQITATTSTPEDTACLKNILRKLRSHFSQSTLNELLENYNKSEDAILLLERNNNNRVLNTFKRYMTENIFPNTKSNSIRTCEVLLHSSQTDVKTLKIDENWNSIKIKEDSKVLVIGGRSMGKSTFVRYSINRNIKEFKKILLIDLDIGQPELFVPQTVNATIVNAPILGPGFFLNQNPNKSYILGSTNVVLIPFLYMKAVKKLINYCYANFPGIPWFINTMGYNKGFGSELITSLIEILKPTDVVQLESNADCNNFEYTMDSNTVQYLPKSIYEQTTMVTLPNYQLHIFQSLVDESEKQFAKEWQLSAKDFRYAMIIGRLGSILRDTDDCLTNVKPICASIEDLKLVNFIDHQITEEDQLKALNANLIYLCKDENDDVYECLGIGIVRAIDYVHNQIYIIPAISRNLLTKVNCLVPAEMPLPTSVLINQGPKIKGEIPFVYNTIDDSRSKFVKNNSSN